MLIGKVHAMRSRILWLCLVVCLPISVGCVATEKPHPVPLQDLTRNPDAYVGETIQFNACVMVSRHGMAISDCADLAPKIAIEFPDSSARSHELNEFIRIAQQEWLPDQDGILKARLTGTVRHAGGQSTFLVTDGRAN